MKIKKQVCEQIVFANEELIKVKRKIKRIGIAKSFSEKIEWDRLRGTQRFLESALMVLVWVINKEKTLIESGKAAASKSCGPCCGVKK